ncbi:MAG: hypothetical protein IPN22_11325 [Bacteroidetes bacterium]|nr:hypothetical protein [Bacteroidota bacterium]
MELFVKGLIYQFNKYKVPAELLVIDWNPAPDCKPLCEILPKPVNGDFLCIRYITVPPAIHQQYRFSKVLPLYQMIAKNVGIRRASADYILCTNVDLLFSDPLMQIMSNQQFVKDTFYRANRKDVSSRIYDFQTVENQLSFAKYNVIRTLGKNSAYLNIHTNLPSLFYSCGLAKFLNFVFDIVQGYRNSEQVEIEKLDTVGCGDFTLMHRNAWEAIAGYPELDFYSIHIDTMALIAAKSLGLKQVIFPTEACTYHIEHTNGWETLSAVERLKFIHDKPGRIRHSN